MKKRELLLPLCLLAAFILWAVSLCLVDVQPIGPGGSAVGFASLNGFFHRLTGVHLALYTLTDWLGLVPLCFMLGFALLGLAQLIKRRSLFKVDPDILVLGGSYILVLAAYIFFELFIVNYRPVLIEGRLEASYPSSTTMLVLCVMPTALMQLRRRVKNALRQRLIACAVQAFTIFMLVGRTVSGVHWLTDIIGGALLSAALATLYRALTSIPPAAAKH